MSDRERCERRTSERQHARTVADLYLGDLRDVCDKLPPHARKFFWKRVRDYAVERLPLNEILDEKASKTQEQDA